MMIETSLHGCIEAKWEADGSPKSVQYVQVLQWAIECDSDLESRGLNPAPEFRKHLKNRDNKVKPYLLRDHLHFRIV
jgi:hypothetical protein